MISSFVFRRLSPAAALLLLVGANAGCHDPQPTYFFDASAPDAAAAGGKAGSAAGGAAGGAGGKGGGSGGIIGSGTGGFNGTASGGFFGSGSGGFTGSGSGGLTGANGSGGFFGNAGATGLGTGGGNSPGGSSGSGSGTGGVTAGSGGGTGTGNTAGGGGARALGGSTGAGGIASAGGRAGSAGAGNAGGSNAGGATGVQVVFSDAALLAAADFELTSSDAMTAVNDCDPTKLSGDSTILDAHGNSWGPKTLPSKAQQDAFANLIHAIFQSIGTKDTAGPGPGGSAGLHGWPNLNPRLTGIATNAANNGPGNRAYNGGLIGYGVMPVSSLLGGALNGELAPLYKAAAIADGLKDGAGNPLTPSSSNADFGSAIAHVTGNPRTAIGLADGIAQCALTISVGLDENGDVVANPTTFTHNVVEDL